MKKMPDAGSGSDGADQPAEKPKAGAEAPAEQKQAEQTDTDKVTEADALRSALGESADRQDAARSMNIIADRLRQLVDAERNPSVVHFYAPARDVNFGAGPAPRATAGRRVAPVDSGHLADYTRAYVEPPAFGDCLGILSERHLLVLSGTDGTGREATALALLDKLLTAPDDGAELPLFSIDVASLADEFWQVPTTGAGYLAIVEQPAMRTFEQFDDAWLSRLSSALHQAGSFVVLVTGQLRGKLTEATKRRLFVVEQFTGPDPMEILRTRVLGSGLGLDAAEVERRLADAGAEAVLADRPRAWFAVTVSDAVIDAIRADRDLTAELERLSDPGDLVREWFTHHEDPQDVAFALATAALEGSSYLTVSDAAVALYSALVPRTSVPPPLRLRRSLATAQPWITVAAEPGAAAAPPTVRFRNQRSQPAVLAYAWTELDGMRPTLLAWLRELVAHADVEVRTRAAFAAGQLANDDLQHAMHHYLLPWAHADSPMLRRGAALALSVVATVPRHTGRVWSILQEFAESAQTGRNRYAPATAAIAAAGPLGSQEPERALRLLRAMSRDGDWDLLEPILIGVLQLVENGRATEVVRALVDWTDAGGDNPVVVKGLVAFVVAAREPAPTTKAGGDHDGDESRTGYPVLLVNAATYYDELPLLWSRALANDKVRKLALASLREWLRLVDSDGSLHPVVLDVLAGIADRSERDMRRLDHYLGRWERDEDDPSPAAGRILDALLAAG